MGPFSSQTSLLLINQAPELITAFDEHRVSTNFKFGVLCQKEGQVRHFHCCAEKTTNVLSVAEIWYDIVAIPSFSSFLRRTYSVTMRKVRILKSSFQFWERQFSCKASLGKARTVSTLFGSADNTCDIRRRYLLIPFPQVQRRTGRVPRSNRKRSSLHFLSGERNHVSRGN